ncbi:MerR family transcriptional regulator [Rhodococcus sp. IEGM 1354]|uniref:MerR family transcriptional regulator n=1 Tax=Rhodococcus sp. IEGM 1354 TaxID=3047088 RepID=UPI0024B65519|nr:MerR family transcriptional regulator [Rhodococcus sp. IEGM 1354]MDI9928843.1 MerR family transcriptional regulator [Rhodococcus sp. IEGM 1354]
MFSIGEFASIGRVSVRMLRHYDEIGLLTPARVDPFTGYRSYDGKQFEELGRILMFKDLGFRLDEVKQIVHAQVSEDRLRRMLVAKREDVAHRLDLDAARLRRIDARLRAVEGEDSMVTVDTKSLPATRVAVVTENAAGYGPQNIGPVIGPMYARLASSLARDGVEFGPSSIALYEAVDDGDGTGITVHAAFEIAPDVDAGVDYDVAELPAVDLALTTVHHGSMATIGETWEQFMAWIDANGYELSGICREYYLVSEPAPQENWVTELQQPVVRRQDA